MSLGGTKFWRNLQTSQKAKPATINLSKEGEASQNSAQHDEARGEAGNQINSKIFTKTSTPWGQVANSYAISD